MVEETQFVPGRPVLGTVVHYVLPDGPERVHGACRPAVVVADWGPLGDHHLVNLVVFRDGSNDAVDGVFRYPTSLMAWETSIEYSRTHEFGTWHRDDECHGSARTLASHVLQESAVAVETAPFELATAEEAPHEHTL